MIRVTLGLGPEKTERLYEADRWTVKTNEHGAMGLIVYAGSVPVAQFQPGQWASVDDVNATFAAPARTS